MTAIAASDVSGVAAVVQLGPERMSSYKRQVGPQVTPSSLLESAELGISSGTSQAASTIATSSGTGRSGRSSADRAPIEKARRRGAFHNIWLRLSNFLSAYRHSQRLQTLVLAGTCAMGVFLFLSLISSQTSHSNVLDDFDAQDAALGRNVGNGVDATSREEDLAELDTIQELGMEGCFFRSSFDRSRLEREGAAEQGEDEQSNDSNEDFDRWVTDLNGTGAAPPSHSSTDMPYLSASAMMREVNNR